MNNNPKNLKPPKTRKPKNTLGWFFYKFKNLGLSATPKQPPQNSEKNYN